MAEAVARYDFPKEVADVLVAKVKRIRVDAVVTIKRDKIEAPFGYAADLAGLGLLTIGVMNLLRKRRQRTGPGI